MKAPEDVCSIAQACKQQHGKARMLLVTGANMVKGLLCI
jgi:hypothetical protein